MALAPEEILDRLDIEAGATVFVKASRRRLGLDRAGTQRLLDAFIRRLGPNGTLVMPSFPWPNDQAVLPLAYEFDLARTPSRMGLLSELFRTTYGTLRGEHYWWPICARGKHAQHLTEGQLTVAASVRSRLLSSPIARCPDHYGGHRRDHQLQHHHARCRCGARAALPATALHA